MSSRDVSYDVSIPAQGEFGSDIQAGDGKLANLFFTVYHIGAQGATPPPHVATAGKNHF